eukprot:357367-Rhodomonas_salina.1
MIDLGMFNTTDLTRVKFTDLQREKYTVWTYCWGDSPWKQMWVSVQKEDPEAHQQRYWFVIFCLNQFDPLKMEAIKQSNEIYGNAEQIYLVIGLASFVKHRNVGE